MEPDSTYGILKGYRTTCKAYCKICDVLIQDDERIVFSGTDLHGNKYVDEMAEINKISIYSIRMTINNKVILFEDKTCISKIRTMDDVDEMLYKLQCEDY